jgi:hypothetical protein
VCLRANDYSFYILTAALLKNAPVQGLWLAKRKKVQQVSLHSGKTSFLWRNARMSSKTKPRPKIRVDAYFPCFHPKQRIHIGLLMQSMCVGVVVHFGKT